MNLKENEVLRCPKCGGRKFNATAHVTQDWEIDEKGDFQKSLNDCIEVTHSPNEDDIIDCVKCGHSGTAADFITQKSEEAPFRTKCVEKYPFAVVSQYSWTYDGNIILFENESAAKNYIKNLYEAEIAEDTACGKWFDAEISDEGDYARITNPNREGGYDVAEWVLRNNAVRVPVSDDEPASDAETLLQAGEFLLPGDKVLVSVPAYRMWGGRCREDTKAPPVDVAGIVLNTNIDRDENTGELTFTCSVAASVPIADTDREYYGTFDIPMGLCTKVEVVESNV